MTKDNTMMLIWLLIPLIYGIVTNTFVMVPGFLGFLVFTVFWFWVGMMFGKSQFNSLTSFLIGNSLWLISFCLYVWQFALLNDESRNMSIALISQYYMLPFVWAGSKLVTTFTNVIHGTTITILSFLVMLLVFTIGFIVGKLKSS